MKTKREFLNNSHLIIVKYLGPTNTRGPRVKIQTFDLRHRNDDKPHSKILSYDYTFNSSDDIAEFYLKKAGLKLIGKNSRHPTMTVFIAKWDFEKMCKFFGVKV